ncbi:Protein kinase APK1A, chloroplastic [Hordeum vulgare]|nr:Protein kinase APK1A, chloroplastic [Hordeum vulgare]
MDRWPMASATVTSTRTRPAFSTRRTIRRHWTCGCWAHRMLSTSGFPVPPPPSRVDRWAEITRIRSSLPESSRNLPRYAPDNNMMWTAYFERRHADQLAATNGDEPRGRHNSEGGANGEASPAAHWRSSSSTLRAATRHG